MPSTVSTPAARARLLTGTYGWEAKHARRVLAVDTAGANLLVDATTGSQGMDGVAEHLQSAFDALCAAGTLCGERLRGVRLDITDAKIHAEAAQRRANQVVPASAPRGLGRHPRRVADPPRALPHRHADGAAHARLGDAYDELSLRRAVDSGHEPAPVSGGRAAAEAPQVLMGAIPLAEAAELAEALRGRLHGAARGLALAPSHFAPCEGDVWKSDGGLAGRAPSPPSAAAASSTARRSRRKRSPIASERDEEKWGPAGLETVMAH